MIRGHRSFSERDMTRALKAAKSAGIVVARVEIDAEKIVLVAGKPTDDQSEALFDKWKAGHARQT